MFVCTKMVILINKMLNPTLQLIVIAFTGLFLFGCMEKNYSDLIFYDSFSNRSDIGAVKINKSLNIGRNESGEIYFIVIYDEYDAEYNHKINLKLDRDSSVRHGFKRLEISTDGDVMVVYPDRQRGDGQIDLFFVENGKVLIRKISLTECVHLIAKYKK